MRRGGDHNKLRVGAVKQRMKRGGYGTPRQVGSFPATIFGEVGHGDDFETGNRRDGLEVEHDPQITAPEREKFTLLLLGLTRMTHDYGV